MPDTAGCRGLQARSHNQEPTACRGEQNVTFRSRLNLDAVEFYPLQLFIDLRDNDVADPSERKIQQFAFTHSLQLASSGLLMTFLFQKGSCLYRSMKDSEQLYVQNIRSFGHSV